VNAVLDYLYELTHHQHIYLMHALHDENIFIIAVHLHAYQN
jgi:hypothetical protein